jgi:Restriction endonuclease
MKSSLIEIKNLTGISGSSFEALTLVLLKKRFAKLVLTPKTNDRGADVIGINEHEVTLIQCKHHLSPFGGNCIEAFRELKNALDYYRENIIPPQFRSIKLMVVMSANADQESIQKAKSDGIGLIHGTILKRMIEISNVTKFDIEEAELRRIKKVDQSEIF